MQVQGRGLLWLTVFMVLCWGGSDLAVKASGIEKLLGSDALEADQFGWSLDVWHDVAVVGSPHADILGRDSGCAYVYRFKDGIWQYETRLVPGEPIVGALFGWSVAVQGKRIVVGAVRGVDGSQRCGTAYVFNYVDGQWVQEGKLIAGDGAAGDSFGYAVAVWEDVVVVGSVRDDEHGRNSGSAYVFELTDSGWSQQAKLTASDGSVEDNFGNAVAVEETTILVGCYRDDAKGLNSGAAYVFTLEQGRWVEKRKLLASDGRQGDNFGWAVAIDGPRLVIGAYGHDWTQADGQCNCGAAYVFQHDEQGRWTEVAKLGLAHPSCGSYFGYSVAVENDLVLVGAPGGYWGSVSRPGTAALFRFDGVDWELVEQIGGEMDLWGEHLGWTVGLSTRTAVVGADWDNQAGAKAGAVYTFDVETGQAVLQSKWTAQDSLAGDGFGYAVAVAGTRAVIGAWLDDQHSGSAYVYQWQEQRWRPEAVLVASDRAAGDLFGWAVDIWADRAIVGAIRNADYGLFTGSAYIFTRLGSKWVEQAKLLASDAAYWDEFGFSVAIWGDVAVVGALRDDDNGANSGAAYVFRFDGDRWVEQQKLLASDGTMEDLFGNAVAVWEDVVIVGAFYADDGTRSNCGAAYVFRFDGSRWVEQQKLVASDARSGDHFGCSVALWGDRAVVGAYGPDTAQPNNPYCNCGSAYVFYFDGNAWVEQAKLQSGQSSCGDEFGWSVDIQEDTIVVGGPQGHWSLASGSGYAYPFWYDGDKWIRGPRLEAEDGEFGDHFGWSIAVMDQQQALVTADWDDDEGEDSGSVYVVDLRPIPADLDFDGTVDWADFAVLAGSWRSRPGEVGWKANCDLWQPRDDLVDWRDFAVLAEAWLEGSSHY